MRKNIIRIVLALVIIAIAVVAGLLWHSNYAGRAGTFTVEESSLLSGVTVSGTIRCKQQLAVAAEVIANIELIPVKEGQHVKKGQILVKLDDSVLTAESAKADARVELARRKLAELRAGTRKEEITKAGEAIKRAQADLSFAQKEHTRHVDAHKRGGATMSELNRSATRLEKAKSELNAAQAHLDLLRAGSRPEEIETALAEVHLADADLKQCEVLRKKHILRATHDGIVTKKYVHVGEIVSPGQVLLHVDNIEDIEIRAQVQESQLLGVKHGSKAQVIADAYPKNPLDAIVQEILPRVDPEQGTITVLMKLTEKPSVVLMDGMAADITIVHQKKKVLRIPSDAIERRGGKTTVQVRRDGNFVRQVIETGISEGKWIEIKSGLQAGDCIKLP